MGGVGSGAKPREYPARIVDLACGLYRSGMTVAEIRRVFPRGYRVQTILERYLPSRRDAVKRDQTGTHNEMWKGDHAGYQAVHLRVAAEKGKARWHRCVDCGESADDWSYAHGCDAEASDGDGSPYCHHPDHYDPRCRPCHRRYDRQEVVPYV